MLEERDDEVELLGFGELARLRPWNALMFVRGRVLVLHGSAEISGGGGKV